VTLHLEVDLYNFGAVESVPESDICIASGSATLMLQKYAVLRHAVLWGAGWWLRGLVLGKYCLPNNNMPNILI
jgi:hypothetical protein